MDSHSLANKSASLVDEITQRLDIKEQRDIERFGFGETDRGQKLIEKYFEDYRTLFLNELETIGGQQWKERRPDDIKMLDVDELTYAAMHSGLSAIMLNNDTELMESGLTASNHFRVLGRAIENICHGAHIKATVEKWETHFDPIIKRTSSLTLRRRLVQNKERQINKDAAFVEWEDEDHLRIGGWIRDVLVAGPMFTSEDRFSGLTLTAEADEGLDGIMQSLIYSNAFVRPQTSKPEDWKSLELTVEGFDFNLISRVPARVRAHFRKADKEGKLSKVYEAINHSQSVAWAINEPVLRLAQWAYANNLDINKFPRRLNLELPKVKEGMTDEEKQKVKRERNNCRKSNRKWRGERIILERDLKTAEKLLGAPFWEPVRIDWRGRVYPLPHFNFQRGDLVRALHQFHEGQVLTEDGLYWLKVHVANCWANEGIDKKPFDERVRWVDNNMSMIWCVLANPHYYLKWTEAESPFMFVAACHALSDGLEGKPVHVPLNFDGSCSGLQHLFSMVRDTAGSLVNLTPSDKPQDIYGKVALEVDRENEAFIKAGVDREITYRGQTFSALDLAKKWQKHGITRKVVKRNVMTYGYSSKTGGMSDQLMKDIMIEDLALKVRKKELNEHPFGEYSEWKAASQYLAKMVYEAIKRTAPGPASVMEFLRKIAAAYAHEYKPTTWATPLGMPVMLFVPEEEERRIRMFLHDRGIMRRVEAKSSIALNRIDKSGAMNGIAPNFVHSMDACHLMMVLLACKDEGIKSVALVHDSFGCLPNDAPKFRDLIRRTFRELYEQNDVLEQIRNEALENIEDKKRIPKLPPKGTLDLALIEQSEYCFA